MSQSGGNSSSAGGSSALVLIGTQNASNSANISFTGLTSAYNIYELVISNLVVSIGGDFLNLSVSTNNGVSYLNTGYDGDLVGANTGNTVISISNQTTSLPVSLGITNGTEDAITYNSMLFLEGFAQGVSPNISGNGTQRIGTAGGRESTTISPIGSAPAGTPINAIRLTCASGNITSGKISLYGLVQ